MNKIYKIIWSKARNCYVVVSELAKRNGKASSGLNKKIIAAFLAAGTVMAVNGSAWADYSNVDITQANDKTITKTYYGNAGSNAIAIGAGTGTNAAKALAEDSIAIGAGAAANYEQNVVIGANSKTKGQLSTAIGADSKAYGYRSVAIGYDAQALDKFASSSDPSDPSNKSRAVAIGAGSRALANRSVAIGDNAIAEQGKAWVVSIGANSYSGLLGANANGYGARAFGKNSVAMGRQARAGEPATDLSMNDATTYVTSKGNMDGFGAVAIGYMADAKKNGSFAVGYKAQAHGVNSMAFGSGQAQTDSDFVNITKALGDNSIAFGYNSRALANNAVSFGAYTEATGQRSLVFGTSGTDAVASGMGLLDNSRAAGQGSIAIGDRAVVDSKILVQSDAPDASVNDAISIGTEAHVRARNAVAIGGNISYTNDDNETVYGRSHNGRDFGALVGEGADSAIAIGGATLDESTSDFTTGTLAVKYEAAASLGKRGVAIGSGALVFSGDAFARYEAKINSTEYQNAKLAFETAESEYLNATMQVSMKETEIASLDPSSADYETEKTRLEGELAALTANANDKLAALDGARPAWQEQEAAALSLQQGNAEAVADAIAIGTNARAGIKNSIALGKDAQTGELAESSIAIGEGAVTGKDAVRAIVIGKDSTVNGADSIAVGHGHTVNGKNSGTFGDPNIVNADNTYVVGNNSTVEKNITNAFVFGNDVTVNNGTLPDGWDTLSDDDKANQTGYGVIAIGNNVTASLNENVSRESGTPKVQHVAAIGDNAVVGEENAVAIGFGAKSIAYNSVSVGTGAVSNAENAMAFGNSAYATEAGGVALGSFSKANRASLYGTTTAGYDASKDADRTGDDADSPAWQSTLGAVSIGVTEEGAKTTATGTRQLTGLAAGTADTDAVNVAQLKAVSAGNSMNFGGDNTTATDNIITVKGGEQLNVKGGAEDLTNDNIGIVADTTKKTLNVKLSNKISLNDGGHLVIGKTTDEKGQTVVDQNGVTLYPASSASGSAITKFTKNGISAGNQKIEYVKAGEADTDAVNVSQLKKARTRLTAGANVTSVKEVAPVDVDGNYSYTIDVDNLSYKANGANETGTKSVKLSDGLNFVDGTNTKAEVEADGVVKINAYKSVVQAKTGDGNVTVTPITSADGFTTTYDVSVKDMHVDGGTTSYGADGSGTATLTHKDGTTAEVTGLKNTYTTGVTYNATDKTATFNRNDGGSYALNLKDMGATDYALDAQEVSVGTDGTVTLTGKDRMNPGSTYNVKIKDVATSSQAAAAKTELQQGTNTKLVTEIDKTDGHTIYTVNADGASASAGSGAVTVTKGAKDADNVTDYAIDLSDATKATLTKAESEGLTFAGDSGASEKIKLGDTLNVKGEATGALTGGNIGVEAAWNTLKIKLAKDVKDVDSIQVNKTVKVGNNITMDGEAVNLTVGGTKIDGAGITIQPASGSVLTKFTNSGISAGGQKVENVAAGTADTDAVNVSQLATAAKAAKTEVAAGTNVTSVVKTTGTDNQSIYTVNVDDLTYQVGTNAAKNVSLKNGLHFVDGTNTTAVQNEDGSIQFNATHNRLTDVRVTPATDSSNAMTAVLADADGNKTTVNLQNTYTTVTKSGNTITFRRNDGVSESISLSDLGATDYRLVPAADGKYKVNGDGSLTLQVKDARNEGAAAVDVKIEDIASKTQQDINTSNIATNREDLDAGWNATVGSSIINVSPAHNDLTFAASDDHVTVTADGRTIKVGVTGLADEDLSNITTDGKTVITNTAREAITVEGTGGIDVTATTDKSKYTVSAKLSDNLLVRDNGNIDLANSVKIGSGVDMHTVTIDGNTGEVTGLMNRTLTATDFGTKGRAATEEQLQLVNTEASKHNTVKAGTNVTVDQSTNASGGIEYKVSATHNKLKETATVTPATDSSNAMTAVLEDKDGNRTTVALQNTYTTVTKDTTAKTVTFSRNDGQSVVVGLNDLGATDYRLVPVEGGNYKAVDGVVTLKVKDALDTSAEAVDVTIEDVASKTQQDTNTTNIAKNRTDLDAGWNAKVGESSINVNPERNDLAFAAADDHVTVTADGRTIKVGVQNLADTGLGNITEEGKTVITNLARDAVTVQGENGIEVTRSADKSTYTVKTKLGDNLTLREGNIDLANTVKIGNGADMHTVIVDGTKGEVTGLTNTTWSKDGAYNAGRAATEEQLKDVYEAAKGDALGSVKLKFQGESDDTLERGNNETLQIVGDESNITTKAEDGKLKVKLSKDLNVNSVTAGNTVINNDGVTADKVTVGGTTIEDKKITVGDTVIDGTSVTAETVTAATVNATEVKAGDTMITSDGLTITGGPSVTKDGIDAGSKKITGVADGTEDGDAVNLSQLKQATAASKTVVEGGTNIASVEKRPGNEGHDIYTVNADGASVSAGSDAVMVTKGAKDANNVTDYAVDLSDATKATLDKAENEGLTFAGDSGNSDKIKLGDTLNLKGGATGALSDSNIGVEAEGDTLNIKLAKDIKGVDTIRVNKSITAGDTVITGDGVTANTFRSGATVINNEGVTATKFTAGETSVSSNGLAIEGGPSVTKGGIDAGGKQVTNVAAGENDTDAATFGQLKDLAAGAGQAINNVSNEISRVDSRMKKGLAGAAALAALHPIDTDDKFTMGLGYGNYRNANAMALGMFYRPTEKIMLSVGGAMGNGENMINAGLSFALDKGKGFGTSKAAMARKINDLTAENAAQAAKIETLEARLAAIESKLEK